MLRVGIAGRINQTWFDATLALNVLRPKDSRLRSSMFIKGHCSENEVPISSHITPMT